MRVMEDVFLSSVDWIQKWPNRVVGMGITHVIMPQELSTQRIKDKFEVYEIPDFVYDIQLHDRNSLVKINPYLLMPVAMDFLRKVALFRGRVLFVESQAEWTLKPNSQQRSSHLVRECMLMCLAAIYQTSAYETYTLIKS